LNDFFASRHEVHSTSIHSTQRRSIKTEYFTTALKLAESQGYRHFRNRTFCNGVGGRTTGLKTFTLQLHYCSLTRNTWYKTTAG